MRVVLVTGIFLLTASTALAGSLSIRACEDEPHPGDGPWAVTRTIQIEAGEGSGTGVLLSPDGFVLTAAHVVHGVDRVKMATPDGTRVDAYVVRRDPEMDLALLRQEGDRADWPCMRLAPTRAQVGADLLAVGSPMGDMLSFSVTKGVVSGYRDGGGVTLLQTDAALNRGNSGGPMVGALGELIGIVSFKLVDEGIEGLGFGIAALDVAAGLGLRFGAKSDPTVASVAPPATHEPVVGYGASGPPPQAGQYFIEYNGAILHTEQRTPDEVSPCDGLTVRAPDGEKPRVVGSFGRDIQIGPDLLRVRMEIGRKDWRAVTVQPGFEVVWRTDRGGYVRLVTDARAYTTSVKGKHLGNRTQSHWTLEFPLTEEAIRILADGPLVAQSWSVGTAGSETMEVKQKAGRLVQRDFACAVEWLDQVQPVE